MGFALVMLCHMLAYCAQSEISLVTLTGESFALEDLSRGRWALAFVVVLNCPACLEVIAWLGLVPQLQLEVVKPDDPDIQGIDWQCFRQCFRSCFTYCINAYCFWPCIIPNPACTVCRASCAAGCAGMCAAGCWR